MANGLRQVLVGIAPAEQGCQAGDDPLQIPEEQAPQHTIVWQGKLEYSQHAAGLKDPVDLLQSLRQVAEVPDAERDRDRLESMIAKGKRLALTADSSEGGEFPPGERQHDGHRVGAEEPAASLETHYLTGHIAGPAGQVQDTGTGFDRHDGSQAPAPGDIHTAEKAIEEIVAAGQLPEHAADKGPFLFT